MAGNDGVDVIGPWVAILNLFPEVSSSTGSFDPGDVVTELSDVVGDGQNALLTDEPADLLISLSDPPFVVFRALSRRLRGLDGENPFRLRAEARR